MSAIQKNLKFRPTYYEAIATAFFSYTPVLNLKVLINLSILFSIYSDNGNRTSYVTTWDNYVS